MAILGISIKDNKEQQEFVRLIQEKNKPIIFCEGLAGTGKSFIALATALESLHKHQATQTQFKA